ncbi:MAG TPA: DsbE family thiol:disulfide interchange protein [Alphaproteobacteria bacterium]|nr:DsbE family thiol:disulfide interchange protein [Alphaproteobacteria bacterium]
MARKLIYLLPIAVFAVLAAAFYAGLGRDPAIVPSALIGKPVPQFALPPLLADKPGLATADLKSKPVLVNVFASWCIPCREEHPLLMHLARDGVAIYGIDYKDQPADAKAWLGELGDPYRRLATDMEGRVAINWGVYGVPETFLVDGTGTIRFKQVGPLTIDVIDRKILPLLKSLAR